MPVAKIASATFTSADRVRDVIHNFDADGFDSLYPKYKGGRPKTFTLPERREIKKIAKAKPVDHGLPFSSWSLAKLAELPGCRGGGRRHQPRGPAHPAPRGRRHLSTREDLEDLPRPDYAAKKARVEHLYAIADGEVVPEPGEPEVIFCLDEFGPLNLQPHPSRQWAERGGRHNTLNEQGCLLRSPSQRPPDRLIGTRKERSVVSAIDAASDQVMLGIDPLHSGNAVSPVSPGPWRELCEPLRPSQRVDLSANITALVFELAQFVGMAADLG